MARRLQDRTAFRPLKTVNKIRKIVVAIVGIYVSSILLFAGVNATAAVGLTGVPFLLTGVFLLLLSVFSILPKKEKKTKKQHQNTASHSPENREKLERLEALYKAGMYTRVEYEAKRREILKDP